MDSIPALLSSIVCGKCKLFLLERFEENGVTKYRCQCYQKVRALLICTNCKKYFLNFPYLIRKANYCSLHCYWTGTDKKQLKICEACHKEFYVKAYLIKKGYGFYCSMACWFRLFYKDRKSIKCRQCGKIFNVPRSVYKTKPKYCSKVCADNFKRDYLLRVCKGCKQKFELPRWEINRGRGSFCTRECFKTYDGETSIERMVRLQLKKMKEPFRQEMRIGRYYADFYLPNRNLIIECDGEYWHRDKYERDNKKNSFLLNLGYKVLRLTEADIRRYTPIILNSLLI